MQLPENRFRQAPAYHHAPQAQPARVVEVPAYDPAQHIPPPAPLPSASITPKGVLYLSKPLMAALHLSPGQAADLLAPMPGSMYWHLDLRPSALRRIDWSGGLKQSSRGQAARVRGLRVAASQLARALTLYLLPGEPHYPGFYPMLPEDAFTAPR